MEEKKYPIGGYAPGNYHCNCCKCGTFFNGDKRAVECEPCAISAKEKFDALSTDEQAEVMKRNIEEVNKLFSDWAKKPAVNLAIMGHGKPTLYHPGVEYQNLFDYLSNEHGLSLFQSEMSDLIDMVHKLHPKAQPGPRWVKCSDRLPGYNQMVKWRQEGGQATPGTSSLLDIRAHLSCLSQWEWLDEQPAAEQWTPAATKPEHNVGVLVFIPGEDNHITSGMWDIDNKWVLLDEYRTPEEEVTHWMPLPSFPEGYLANQLPDEIGAMIKEIAREELGKKEQPAAGREEDAGFRETIEDIILSTGKHNQEQCSEIADVILRDLLIWLRYQRKDYQPGREEAVFDSKWLIGRSEERFKELAHKGWDWRSFYNGWIEGRSDAWCDFRGKESAVEFAEWAIREEWNTSHDGKGWMKHSDETPYVLTTAELYELFKQQKEK